MNYIKTGVFTPVGTNNPNLSRGLQHPWIKFKYGPGQLWSFRLWVIKLQYIGSIASVCPHLDWDYTLYYMSTVLRLRVTTVFKLLSADRLNVLGVFWFTVSACQLLVVSQVCILLVSKTVHVQGFSRCLFCFNTFLCLVSLKFIGSKHPSCTETHGLGVSSMTKNANCFFFFFTC